MALELLTKPSLLFLDEPTSGLDPGLDKSVMEMMAGLAHDGRTVIVVTHSVANLDLCDRLLVLVPGGKVAFFGPPRDGLRHFGQPGWAEVFQAFEAEPGRDWAGEFRRSPLLRAVRRPGRWPPPPRPPRPAAGHAAAAAATAQPPVASSAPCAGVTWPSSRPTGVYLGVPGRGPDRAGGDLAAGLVAGQGLAGAPDSNTNAEDVLLILAIGACFTGALNSIREIVKERSIYTRERAAGLSSGAYLWSKLLVLGVLSALQAALMTVIGLAGKPLPPQGSLIKRAPLLEIVLAMALLAIASMTLGLLISSSVSTSEKGLPLLFVIGDGAGRLHRRRCSRSAGKAGLEQVAWLSPSRWGFGAVASTTNLAVITPPAGMQAGPALERTPRSTWLLDMGMMVVLAAVFSVPHLSPAAGPSPARRR